MLRRLRQFLLSPAIALIGTLATSGLLGQELIPSFTDAPEFGMSPRIELYDPAFFALRETPVERFRKSFYQGAELLGGHLLDTGDAAGGLDVTFEEARAGFAVPLGSLENILVLRPYFRADHFNGPHTVDVPGTLYNTGVTFFNRKEWSPLISTTLVVTPSVRSDFTTRDNAFRLFGLGLIHWQYRSDLSLSFGAVYLGRADLPLLPALGATWTPTPQWKVDAMLPRPRIARRLWKDGGNAETWAYLGGTLGGNTWAVTRDSGETDELTLSDLRLFGGWEWVRTGNRGLYFEAGYAFNRTIEYERNDIEIDLDDALFLEASLKF
ncbi:hypothetical protein Pla52o_18280 [Novipirellula galeiformis]|uniref:Uncharacterized protein n=1 Tax=Novipirellula galeiformis TaxID=2528004 RepID=A0A5C6CII7_9BACT|nr:hypothetical protein [Novipirellula galeiformis]TWU23905.1 hypothetical protein Pla52o_18280 [Novipirellula galeiformis]